MQNLLTLRSCKKTRRVSSGAIEKKVVRGGRVVCAAGVRQQCSAAAAARAARSAA